jgi:hypothetical protein
MLRRFFTLKILKSIMRDVGLSIEDLENCSDSRHCGRDDRRNQKAAGTTEVVRLHGQIAKMAA